MHIEFDKLPDSSRLWIFQSSNELDDSLIQDIENHLTGFISNWQAHGSNLLASFKILYNRFIIISLDEASYQATGCSIDKLTHLVLQIEKQFSISLMDRMQIGFEEDGKVDSLPMPKFKVALSSNLNEDTLVFNNLIETKGQLNTEWKVAVKNSWHSRMLS